MSQVTIIHKEDVGATLDTSSGKLEAAASMTTDAELAALATTQATVDAAQDAALIAAIQASETADATEEQKILENVRLQEGLFHNAMWELDGHLIKAHTIASSHIRFLSISSLGFAYHANFYFPQPGESVPSLQGVAALVVDAQGFIELPSWGVLWYKHAGTGQGWYWSVYSAGGVYLDPEYIRVVYMNSDEGYGGINGVLSNGHTIVQGRNYPDTNWITLAPYYAANVSDYGGGYQPPRFRRLNNRVYLGGLIRVSNTTAKGLATLPPDFCPRAIHIVQSPQNSNNGVRVDIHPSGVIAQSIASTEDWISLDGINFGLE